MKKKQKQRYRIRNWCEYNAALVKRGSLTVWLDESAVSGWIASQKSGRRGASRTYSEAAIQAILLLKAVYHLPLRGAQGFVQSLLKLMGLALPVPHYSTLSRRQVNLELVVSRVSCAGCGDAIHLVVDSTGGGFDRLQGLRGRRVESAHSWQKQKAHLAQAASGCKRAERRDRGGGFEQQ